MVRRFSVFSHDLTIYFVILSVPLCSLLSDIFLHAQQKYKNLKTMSLYNINVLGWMFDVAMPTITTTKIYDWSEIKKDSLIKQGLASHLQNHGKVKLDYEHLILDLAPQAGQDSRASLLECILCVCPSL